MTSTSLLPSVNTTSKFALPPPETYPARYSITNRCGFWSSAVKTPCPPAFVSRSSHKSSTDAPSIRDGRQAFAHQRFSPVKLTIPFELMSASLYVWS
jgi:hypothetical protein